MSDDGGRDLSVFEALNERSPRASWEERSAVIHQEFPSIDGLDWPHAFDQDIDLLAAIMRDVLKADASEPGRPGPRPALEWEAGTERLKQMMGADFTNLPFAEAFSLLIGDRSLTSVARKTGLSKTVVHRFMKGERHPSREQIEQVARGFKKHPSYFAEYRTAQLVDLVERRLYELPENAIAYYRQAFFGIESRSA